MGAPPRSRIFASDEELAKRDDDHKPSKMGSWNVKNRPTWRKRRLFLFLLAAIAIWLFVHYIPTDLGPVDRRTGRRFPPNSFQPPSRAYPPPDPNAAARQAEHAPPPPTNLKDPSAPRPDDDTDIQDRPQRDFDGPVKFYYLASTLRAARAASDAEIGNKNVLFAASDLKAAAALIPLACEMSRWKRNLVHLAIMGRSDISIDTIQQLNGVSSATCNIFWHDARPDFITISTNKRMQISVAGALGHINSFVHPTTLITAMHEHEDVFFSMGVDNKIRQIAMTHIQVPKDNPESLAWLSRLDSSSLKAWHAASIDILIRAPLDSSGSLVRLLKSLAQADYTGFRPPRLTVELPHKLDAATQTFINKYHWPPGPYSTPGQLSELTVRRRIFEQRASVDEASHRFIESFYPSSPAGPHVFLLSPQAELSPVYFHYLKLHLLEYLHSTKVGDVERNLLGISLESPTTHLDGKTAFITPKAALQQSPDDPSYVPFRWQAPSANAALYFADKWMEIHSFLMRRHSATRQTSLQSHFKNEKKLVSYSYPAWMEYILQLMQNRGTSMLYPAVRQSATLDPSDSLVTIHNELYQVPEEFSHYEQPAGQDPAPSSDDILIVKNDYLSAHHPSDTQRRLNTESPLLKDLNSILPSHPRMTQPEPNQNPDTDGFPSLSGPKKVHSADALPRLATLPLLDFSGREISAEQLSERAKTAQITFRSTAGGCSDEQSKSKKRLPMSAEDLFCFDDDEDEQTKAPGSFPVSASEAKHDDVEEEDDDDDDEEGDEDIATHEEHLKTPPPANPPVAGQVQEPISPIEVPNVVQAPPAADPMKPLAGQNPVAPLQPPSEPAQQPGPEPPLPPAAQPLAPQVLEANTGQGGQVQPPPEKPAHPDSESLFPVLDPSRIQAFDEGREAERDVPADDDK